MSYQQQNNINSINIQNLVKESKGIKVRLDKIEKYKPLFKIIELMDISIKTGAIYDSGHCVLENKIHSLMMFDCNQPLHNKKKIDLEDGNQQKNEKDSSIIYALGHVQGLVSTLKFLKLTQKQNNSSELQSQKSIKNISNDIFCRPVINSLTDQRTYWIVRNKRKHKLNFDNPKSVLILPNNYLITVERKYINLYQIEEDLSITLKDFDSNGLGKKFISSQIKTVEYKQSQYVLIFGNEEQNLMDALLVIVFEIVGSQLKFVQKAKISEKQTTAPTIIFESDPNSKEQQKFCLVLGGCCQNYKSFHYYALRIDLHLLLNDFLTYDVASTQVIPFADKKNVILSGKAINFKDVWYCFCSEEQTINKIDLGYGGKGKIVVTKIEIKSERLNLKQKIYFSQDSIHYIYEGNEDKIVFLDKNLDLQQRPLKNIIQKVHN